MSEEEREIVHDVEIGTLIITKNEPLERVIENLQLYVSVYKEYFNFRVSKNISDIYIIADRFENDVEYKDRLEVKELQKELYEKYLNHREKLKYSLYLKLKEQFEGK